VPVAEYFSQDYNSARERFRHAARSAGATLQTFELPGYRDPSNRPLTIDVGCIGAQRPDRAQTSWTPSAQSMDSKMR
jgi:hypothetical protein